ncbi:MULTISPECIES: beta-ketoacyl synthase N-terminal-like domain-containing protein [unclassified Nocardia]|uniref:beta-ketoacyl synthase N-terminal-like domain-containing protein n=2 Tax=Nocardia TaxID=1817 RepID=UPI00278C06AC|nr:MULTISPECIES: beta-ketoacyl synthase N-terminal-like domain-containing protein [unclassified Nocardia]
MRRVVITGIGAVTPLGLDAATTWRNLVAGNSGVGPLTVFDSTGFPVRIAGQVRDFEPARRLPATAKWRQLSRAGQFGVAAAAEALAASGVPASDPPGDARGVAMGGSVGRPDLRLLVDIGRARETTGRPDVSNDRRPASP